MSPKKDEQPINQAPTLQIDAATIQAVVSAAVSAFLTHLNANNANVSGIINNNSNPSNNQIPQRAANYHDTPSSKTKSNKRKFWDRKKDKSRKGTNKKQPRVTTFTTTTSIPPTTIPSETPVVPNPARQYAGNLPNCIKCNYHHLGPCRGKQCSNCNKKRHTKRYRKSLSGPTNNSPNAEGNQTCHHCGEFGHYKRECPKKERTCVPITPTRRFTSTTNVGTVHICHQCGEIGHLQRNCPITQNSGADGKILRITAAGEPAQEPR